MKLQKVNQIASSQYPVSRSENVFANDDVRAELEEVAEHRKRKVRIVELLEPPISAIHLATTAESSIWKINERYVPKGYLRDKLEGILDRIYPNRRTFVHKESFSAKSIINDFLALLLLEHKNIVQPHSAGGRKIPRSDSFKAVYRMECVDDFNQIKPIDFERDKIAINSDIQKFLIQLEEILKTLEYIHKQGVIHRDIKPGNILLYGRSKKDIKIIDFDLAKIDRADLGLKTGEEKTGLFGIGTPEFMPPEQAIGEVTDPTSDLYAVASIIMWVLSGEYPIDLNINPEIFRDSCQGEEELQRQINLAKLRAIEVSPPRELVELNPLIQNYDFNRVIASMLDKVQEDRIFQSAADCRAFINKVRQNIQKLEKRDATLNI